MAAMARYRTLRDLPVGKIVSFEVDRDRAARGPWRVRGAPGGRR